MTVNMEAIIGYEETSGSSKSSALQSRRGVGMVVRMVDTATGKAWARQTAKKG